MSQTSYLQMVNEPGLPFRQHLNENLLALLTDFAGDVEPATTAAYMSWLDTSVSPAALKRRNAADSAWVLVPAEQFIVDLASATGADLVGVSSSKTLGDLTATYFQKYLLEKPIVVVITGQSNAVGVNSGGPNPASSLVKTWNGTTNTWGSSNYTAAPWSLAAPNGNGGNNNIGLAFAHRLAEETGRPVYIIYDAVGGRPISDWTASGTSSVRYAAIKTKVEAALASPELSAFGITTIDYLIWAQGEEDALTDTTAVYLGKFQTLDNQFRAETWMESTTPMLVMGMSGLHTRYQVWLAHIEYCENYNKNCVYVNSRGLKTQFDIDALGDYTHWLGNSLWEHGYHRAWYALQERGFSHRTQAPLFYGRGTGPATASDDTIICTGKSLVSRESASGEFPFNAASASGSITWGFQCVADGNYTMSGGYLVTNDNLTNYSFAWGRESTQNANADYSGMFGYQNDQTNSYQFCAGRGHTLADSGGAAVGTFSKYTTTQADNVIWQVGIGTSAGARKNGLAVRKSGIIEMENLPVYADNTAAGAGGLVAGQMYRTSTGVVMVRF